MEHWWEQNVDDIFTNENEKYSKNNDKREYIFFFHNRVHFFEMKVRKWDYVIKVSWKYKNEKVSILKQTSLW